MQTSREEIHSHRYLTYRPSESIVSTKQLFSGSVATKANALIQQQPQQNNLEAELYACYAAQNTEESQKKLLKFLRNPNKIRGVLESALRDVLNGFGGTANKGNKSVAEIQKLINEELLRRSNQSNVLIKR